MEVFKEKNYSFNARDVIFIEIANINETKMPIIFHPIYTYSIFEEERITGYKDLNINVMDLPFLYTIFSSF